MAVKFVQNNTDREIWFRNTEWSGNFRQIPGGEGRDVGGAWVPWARNEQEFFVHHFEIFDAVEDRVKWYIWQQRSGGDFIRANANGWQDAANPVAPDPRRAATATSP